MVMMENTAVVGIELPLPLLHRGKVRDVFEIDRDRLLIVATDRISAFDVVMDDPIPGKGVVLTQLSVFWFDKTQHLVPNHLLTASVDEFPDILGQYRQLLSRRSMLVRRTEPIRYECVVRGYLAGSAWRDYHNHQSVAGISLPAGLRYAERLDEPLFTPAIKAQQGHDENITFEQLCKDIGEELAWTLRRYSTSIYHFAHNYAYQCGLIVADTKFEFGFDAQGKLLLIDELLTPDSSRYWLAEHYAPGMNQFEFDKQILRDWLDQQAWNRTYPPPRLSPEIIEKTRLRYHQALERLIPPHIN